MSKENITLAPYSELLLLDMTPDVIADCKTVPWEENCGFQTANDYFEQTEKFQQVKFGVAALDDLTKGGIDVGSITEIFGESGCGKTQLCMQLALNCALPAELDGLDGCTCFISTDKHLPVKRLHQMANALTAKHKVDVPFLDRIKVWEFNTTERLSLFMMELPALLEQVPNIRLIVIDSIAGIFRYETDYIQRAIEMRETVQELERLADIHNFAIVTTNHITGVPQEFTDKVTASCGVAWDNLVVTKIEVKKGSERSEMKRVRVMKIIYSPRLPSEKANFLIDASGVVDVVDDLRDERL